MRRIVCMCLTIGLLFAAVGCQKKGLSQPDFPLEKGAVTAALEKSGLPWEVSDSETHSNAEGQISYALRDRTKTYGASENKVLMANVSSAVTEGEHFLSMTFLPMPGEEARPFAWEDWKTQMVFTALLYGGFEDEEAVYRAFSDQEIPSDTDTYEWEAQLPGAYCRVRYLLRSTEQAENSQPCILYVTICESKQLYEKLNQELKDKDAAPVFCISGRITLDFM